MSAVAPANGASGAAAEGKADRDAKAKDKKAKKKARAKEKKADAKEQSEKIAKIKAEIAAKADAEDAAADAVAAANGDSESAVHGSDGVPAAAAASGASSSSSSSSAASAAPGAPAAVQYVREEQEVSEEFRAMFAKFLTPEQLAVREESIDEFTAAEQERAKLSAELASANAAGAGAKGPDIHTPVPVDSTGKKLSRKERKRKGRLDIAELKQVVERPDVVELHDTNSSDPKTLIHLKGYRNSVPVPKHWAMKRKYLQGKRGIEKPPFQLPQCIADTGIAQLRGAMQEKTDAKGAKGKAREKTQVKMGKLDIDYQVLHDAFFRHQTKPRMTEHGQMYYEGKELEVRHKDARPGFLSEALRNALGMADEKSPPPWLYAMQRFGPPPCYPFLKVPGVNAPIPEGARWGPGEGEWGVAPVDGFGRPLFGDVFGQERREEDEQAVDRALWGLMADDDDEPEPSDDEKDDGAGAAAADADADGEERAGAVSSAAAAAAGAAAGAGADSKRGTESVTSQSTGLETPQAVPLRKSDGTGTETPDAVRALYTVLQEKGTSVGGAMFGTSHTYVLPTAASEAERKLAEKKAKAAGAVDVALAPEELEGVDAATLKRKYEATVAAQSKAAAAARSDVSDVVAEETQKKKRKLDKAAAASAADGGKKKDKFKF